MTDITNALFDEATYEDARISEDIRHPNTIRIERVRDTKLTLIFSLHLNGDTFQPGIRIDAEIDGYRGCLHSSQELTEEIILFWRRLIKMGHQNSHSKSEQAVERAVEILTTGKPPKKKKKKDR